MTKLIKLVLTISLLGIFASCAKKTQCTTEDQSKWLDQETFKQDVQQRGYIINEFKVTEGNCYEIYGTDRDQKKVEIYFNPVDGSIVKEEVHL